MIYARHQHFVSSNALHEIHKELMSKPQWVFRNDFWRYYLIDGLNPYNESDLSTWYGNQLPSLGNSLRDPWKQLFNSVFELAGPNFTLQRYALTGQTQGQEQTMHADTSVDLTGDYRSYLIYLNTDWDISWGGLTEFELGTDTIQCEVPEPGKLIVFDSQCFHRGLGPTVPNKLRLSLVIHGKHN